MARYCQYFFGLFIAVLLVAAPAFYSYYRQANTRNFRVVREGVLYRSGQMSISGLKDAIRDHGIKTVVTLRDAYYPDDPAPDLAEENYCKAEEINYVRISPRTWWAPDGSVPADEGVCRFLGVMDNPENFPVLVHCYAGIHRTGAFCAVFRMEYDHWTNEHAIAELRACGYRDLSDEWDLLGYLQTYQPRWKNEKAIEYDGANAAGAHDTKDGTGSR
ncbi:MAG TPA: tyrosine-protein phosphatase [Gemmataceae bacterium]|nr:tyrosine-protein phosphatase [Gemmataceae bacterium]